jgi:hypothetical protein
MFLARSKERKTTPNQKEIMAFKKLEWLADYKELNPDPLPRENKARPSIVEFEASNEIFEYKKGEIINVDEMGGGRFRDVDRNIDFQVYQPGQYRLL